MRLRTSLAALVGATNARSMAIWPSQGSVRSLGHPILIQHIKRASHDTNRKQDVARACCMRDNLFGTRKPSYGGLGNWLSRHSNHPQPVHGHFLLSHPKNWIHPCSETKRCVLASIAFRASLLPKLAEHEGHATTHDKGASNGIADGHRDQILDQDVAPRQWCS